MTNRGRFREGFHVNTGIGMLQEMQGHSMMSALHPPVSLGHALLLALLHRVRFSLGWYLQTPTHPPLPISLPSCLPACILLPMFCPCNPLLPRPPLPPLPSLQAACLASPRQLLVSLHPHGLALLTRDPEAEEEAWAAARHRAAEQLEQGACVPPPPLACGLAG